MSNAIDAAISGGYPTKVNHEKRGAIARHRDSHLPIGAGCGCVTRIVTAAEFLKILKKKR